MVGLGLLSAPCRTFERAGLVKDINAAQGCVWEKSHVTSVDFGPPLAYAKILTTIAAGNLTLVLTVPLGKPRSRGATWHRFSSSIYWCIPLSQPKPWISAV